MGAGATAAVVCCLCCFMFAPFVLQSVGFFTPKWGSNSTCDSIGLLYSCCSGNDNDTCKNTEGGDELDVRALGLQATSFAIMFITVASLCCNVFCSNDEDEGTGKCAALGGCCFILFPVAGLFSIIGCIIVATKFSTSDLGYSFALCLTAGCFVVLITIVGCWLLCKSMKNDDDDSPPAGYNTDVSHTSESGAVYPYSGQRSVVPSYGGGYAAQNVTMEQAAVVHDHESGSIMVFMRRINITRIVGQFSHDS